MVDALHDTTWILDDPVGTSGAVAVEVVLAFADGNVSGFSGCNRFRGAYVLSGEALEFGPLAGTMMACTEEAMAIEHEVLRRLGSTVRARVSGGALTLLDAADEPLLEFVAQRAEGLHGQWLVTGINYPAREAIISARGQLSLTIDDGAIHGNGGCNQFRGRFAVTDDGVSIGPLMTTRKFCRDDTADGGPTVMEQEAALIAALEHADGYRLEGSRLTLTRPDGGISVLLRRA